MNKLHIKISDLFQKYPDVLYGFSGIGFSDYKTQYKCALVFAIPHSKFLTINSYKEEIFHALILETREKANCINDDLSRLFNECKIKLEIPPMSQSSEETLLAPFSFKYAAVHAGLGWIGKNGVFVTEKYGPRVKLSTVLINYDLPLGSPIINSFCPNACNECIKACPYKALTGCNWNINTKRSDLIDYFLCNKMRCLYIEKHNRKHSCGLCLVSCPLGL